MKIKTIYNKRNNTYCLLVKDLEENACIIFDKNYELSLTLGNKWTNFNDFSLDQKIEICHLVSKYLEDKLNILTKYKNSLE